MSWSGPREIKEPSPPNRKPGGKTLTKTGKKIKEKADKYNKAKAVANKYNKALNKKGIYKEIIPGTVYSSTYKKWADEYYKHQLEKLNANERKAINRYLLGSTSKKALVNATLDDEQKTMVHNIDSAMKKTSIPHNMKTFRMTRAKFHNTLNVGDVFKNRGFTSTSIDRNFAMRWSPVSTLSRVPINKFFMDIRLKKGQHGIYVGNHNWGDVAHVFTERGTFPQRELILPRDTKFRVIEKKKNSMVVEML